MTFVLFFKRQKLVFFVILESFLPVIQLCKLPYLNTNFYILILLLQGDFFFKITHRWFLLNWRFMHLDSEKRKKIICKNCLLVFQISQSYLSLNIFRSCHINQDSFLKLVQVQSFKANKAVLFSGKQMGTFC